jgi:hypothetical protein
MEEFAGVTSAPVVVDDEGRVFYGTTFGRVRLEPRAAN